MGCTFSRPLHKEELSKPIKMQNIDIQCAVRVGQGEGISVECKVFFTALIHHVVQRRDSLNVFIAELSGRRVSCSQ